MIRATFDTNIYLSAFVHKGTLARAFELGYERVFQLLVSPSILEEVERKLRDKFNQPEEQIQRVLLDILDAAELVVPIIRIDAVPRDPDDNRILECALAGHADVIVSGDKDLLSLGSFQGIPILTARQFLDTLPA